MNVASLERCKELYELSRWDDCYIVYWNRPNHRPAWLVEPLWYITQEVGLSKKWAPAYDLGYLLRKLPKYQKQDGKLIGLEIGIDSTMWVAGYEGVLYVRADTPENAATMLAIELFKQKILTKEQ